MPAPEELHGARCATTELRARAALLRQEMELLRRVFEEVAIPPFLSTGKCRLCFFFPGNTLIFSTAQFSADEIGFWSLTVYLSNTFADRAQEVVGNKNPTDNSPAFRCYLHPESSA